MERTQINKLEKVIQSYIPKAERCRFEEQKRELLRANEKERILSAIPKNMIEVNFTNDWIKKEPDMSVCKVCKETIYATQYELKYYLNGEEIKQERPVKVCEPCYVKMEK